EASSRLCPLLLLPARTESALDAMTDRLARHLRGTPDVSLADVAYTLHVGRKDFSFRRAVVCRDSDDAVACLEANPPGRVRTAVAASRARPVIFIFPGQGSQYAGMGRDLYRSEAAFRETIDRCAQLLEGRLGQDLRSL